MQSQITISYQNGESVDVMAYPPDFAKWERAEKKTIQEFGAMWDILFVAHSAIKREAGTKPIKPLEAWMESVTNIELGADNPKAISAEA
jgi:hypothetical protein